MLDNGVISQYAYTGDGDRLSQMVGGVTTGYVFDPVGLTQVLAETTAGQSTFYVPGLAQYSVTGWEYYGPDRLGSVRTLIDPTGELLLARNYDPFGNMLVQGGEGNSGFGYTGEQVDSTGLVYLRARYYQPSIGRFLTPDSIVPNPLSSQGWNRYAYVENNPVRYSDPSGHCFFAGIDTVACIAVAKITIEALALGGALYLVNSEPFQQATFNAGRGLREILETIPPISPGEFNPVAPFPGNVCSEPGLLPGAPPVELPSFFPGPTLETQPPTQIPGISVERPAVLGGNALFYKGGRYKDLPGGPGIERHHIPADSISPFSRYEGPAIEMDVEDHRQTASWGSSANAIIYRTIQKRLIKQGRFMDAVQMDIEDIRSKFGSKYDDAIEEMLNNLQ